MDSGTYLCARYEDPRVLSARKRVGSTGSHPIPKARLRSAHIGVLALRSLLPVTGTKEEIREKPK